MNAPNLTPATARQIMDLAAVIERDEAFIKQALIDLARAGDCHSVIKFTALWQTRSSSWVAARIEASLRPSSKPRRRGRGAS